MKIVEMLFQRQETRSYMFNVICGNECAQLNKFLEIEFGKCQ